MKKILLLSVSLLCAALPAQAQPIESEPLGPAPYTLKGETDPMALDSSGSSAVPVQPAQNSGFAPIPQSEDATAPTPIEPQIVEPVSQPEPAPQAQDVAPSTISYPKTNVSGVIPEDPSKFENRVFCTLKVSFGSYASGTDKSSGEKIKSYLDANTHKLTYTRKQWGKEGEYDYCVKVNDHKEKADVYKNLKKLVPKSSAAKGPVILSGDGFATVSTEKKNFRE